MLALRDLCISVREKIDSHGGTKITEIAIKAITAKMETMIETEVTYTLAYEGKLYVIEDVPARVCQETGEECFAPETVEHIQAIIKGERAPDRMIETPVYEYA